jgi:hypothetical protein
VLHIPAGSNRGGSSATATDVDNNVKQDTLAGAVCPRQAYKWRTLTITSYLLSCIGCRKQITLINSILPSIDQPIADGRVGIDAAITEERPVAAEVFESLQVCSHAEAQGRRRGT